MQGGAFFLALFGLFFVLWFAGGGPDRPLSFAGPYLNPITTSGTLAQPYGDPTQFSSINSTVTIGAGGVAVSSDVEGVSVSRDVSGTGTTDAKSEYVVVNYSSWSEGTVSAAGWKLVNKKGESALFPQGVAVPKTGKVNELGALTLRPGDQVIVSTGRSPIGVSFRENKCTGYLEENQDFRPALSLSCPTPWEEYSRFYDDDDRACEQFVQGVPYCSSETDIPSGVSNSCEQFAEQYIDYNGCVAAHSHDTDFDKHVWRVYLGRRDELWPRTGGTITLHDAKGDVIDSLAY